MVEVDPCDGIRASADAGAETGAGRGVREGDHPSSSEERWTHSCQKYPAPFGLGPPTGRVFGSAFTGRTFRGDQTWRSRNTDWWCSSLDASGNGTGDDGLRPPPSPGPHSGRRNSSPMLSGTRVRRELGWQVLTIWEREAQDVATVERRPTATTIDRGMVARE